MCTRTDCSHTLFSSEICWYLAPRLCIPLEYRYSKSMGAQPHFSPSYQFKCLFRFGGLFEFCLALLFLHPYLCIDRVRVYHLVCYILLLHQGEGMYYCKKFPYVVGPLYRTEMKHLRSRLQIHALILHRTRIARTASIDSPTVCFDLDGQRQNSIIPVCRRILQQTVNCELKLHSLRYFYAEQCHTVLYGLGNIGGYHQAHLLLAFRLSIEY